MKTTIDLPDALVTEIKIEAAKQKRKLKDLVPELVRAGLEVRRVRAPRASKAAAAKWLDEWVAMGKSATKKLAARPSAREILAADRGRLDRS